MPVSSISGSPTSSPRSLSASATDTIAGKAEPAPVGDGARLGADQQRAVLVEASRRHLVDDRRARRAQAAPDRRRGTAPPCRRRRGAPSAACSAMCSASPCTGIRICGRTQPIMSSSSARRGWPETCTRWVRSVMTSMPWLTRPLITAHDRLLVAGNGARGEDHAVAARERRPRDARPRRCARAPRAARPGCRCRAPPPCRAADGRRHRPSGNRWMPSR